MLPINQLLNLSGKVAVVTGGAAGVGLGIVYRLVEAGATVVIADSDGAKAKEITTDLTAKGFKAFDYQFNVADEFAAKALAEYTAFTIGSLDVLVNNAGIYPSMPISQMSAADFDNVLAVNLRGAFFCLRYAAEQMVKLNKGGRIINITSIDALHPSMIGLAHYDASKSGLWGLTKNAALEYATHKIWINAIAPGAINTPGVAALGGTQQPPADELLQKIPMQRMGEPDDIGKVVLFLASDMSGYMTGTQIVVDGGVLLN